MMKASSPKLGRTRLPRARELLALSTTAAAGLAVTLCVGGGCVFNQADDQPAHASGGEVGATVGATHAAATVGSSTSATSGVGGAAQTAPYTLSLNNASPQVDLNDTAEVLITIDPKGFSGAVTFSVDALAATTGVTPSFANDMVTLDGTTPATMSLVLTTVSSAPPTNVPLTITATSSAGTRSVPATLTVSSTITINIPDNVDSLEGASEANPNKTAFGDYPTVITAPQGISAQKPVTIHFYNADSIGHEIHAGQEAQGFPHGQGTIAPHTMEAMVREVTAAGTYDYYLHDETKALNVGRIVIQ